MAFGHIQIKAATVRVPTGPRLFFNDYCGELIRGSGHAPSPLFHPYFMSRIVADAGEQGKTGGREKVLITEVCVDGGGQ